MMHTVASVISGALELLRARKQKFEEEHVLPIMIEEVEDWIAYFEKIDRAAQLGQHVEDYGDPDDDDDGEDDDEPEEVSYMDEGPADTDVVAPPLRPNVQTFNAITPEMAERVAGVHAAAERQDDGVSGFSASLAEQPFVSTPHERANWWEGNEAAAPEEVEEAPGFEQQVPAVADSPAGFAVPEFGGAPIDTTPRFIQGEPIRNPFGHLVDVNVRVMDIPMQARATLTPPPAEGEATGFGAPSSGG